MIQRREIYQQISAFCEAIQRHCTLHVALMQTVAGAFMYKDTVVVLVCATLHKRWQPKPLTKIFCNISRICLFIIGKAANFRQVTNIKYPLAIPILAWVIDHVHGADSLQTISLISVAYLFSCKTRLPGPQTCGLWTFEHKYQANPLCLHYN